MSILETNLHFALYGIFVEKSILRNYIASISRTQYKTGSFKLTGGKVYFLISPLIANF